MRTYYALLRVRLEEETLEDAQERAREQAVVLNDESSCDCTTVVSVIPADLPRCPTALMECCGEARLAALGISSCRECPTYQFENREEPTI